MKKFIFSCAILIFGYKLKAQNTSVIESDASSLLEAYFSPLSEGVGAGINNGWYNTAKPHKLYGFDVTFTLNNVMVPTEMLRFNPNDIKGGNFSGEDVPSILGSGEGSTVLYLNPNDPNNPIEFTTPDRGYVSNMFLPVPMVNAGIGIGFETEIDFRYFPKVELFSTLLEAEFELWGVGIQHDLLQWIPVVGDVIPISLSFQAGHTQLSTSLSINDPVYQEIGLDVNATTINLIASKKLLMFTAYASIGYNSSVTTFRSNNSFDFGTEDFITLIDRKLELNFETQNEVRANIGVRYNLTILALQANHTFSKYPVTTFGIGISLR